MSLDWQLFPSFFIAAILAFVTLAVPAQAQMACAEREKVVAHLLEKYDEVPVGVGISNSGPAIELLAAPDGRTWTVIVSQTDGMSCMISAGEGWQRLHMPVAKKGPQT